MDETPVFEPESQEPHQHRGVDEEGNKDDNFTEKEALDQAAAQGIYFEDSYRLSSVADFTMLPEGYDNRAEAEDARLKREDADQYQVVQTRTQKTS